MAASVFPRSLLHWSAAALLAGCAGGASEADPSALSVAAPAVVATRVDRPGAAPAINAATTNLQYFGGSVTANPKVYVVWWGDPAKMNAALTAAHGGIADFFAGVTNSSYMDWLNQYNTNIPAQAGSHMGNAGTGQLIGRGNYVGAVTLSNIPAGNITDDQIRSTLDAAFTAGTLPPPDDNALYAVFFPPGVTITLDGSKSCSSYGAYHDAIIETQRHNTYYLVMPDCGSSFNSRTSVTSHELLEAMTDNLPTPGSSPNYPQAWNDAMGNEVADVCSSSGTLTTALGTFTVQNVWDQRTKACKAFSSDANDFNVAISPNVAMVAPNAASTFTVQTATSAGTAQMLTLSATAPTGVTATISPTTINSGATATLTVTATGPSAPNGVQVVVRADTMGATVQTHTAALLLSSSSAAPPDLGQGPADLALPSPDLAQPPTESGTDAGATDDLSLGTGGTGNQAPAASGCGCVIGAHTSAPDSTWLQVTLLLLAFGLLASRRRRRRAGASDRIH